MAPFADSNNPLAAGNEQPRYGGAYLVYASTKTTLPIVGQIVCLKAWTTVATKGDWTGATPPVLAKAIKCPDATGKRMIGVCVGGSTLTTNPVATGTVMVCSEGIAQVNILGATTANHQVIITTAHAGNGKDSTTPVAGKTLGVILQTKATATTPKHNHLITCYIHKT
jgi:hypothetical protein